MQMVFLIQYNRSEGKLVQFKSYEDSDRALAQNQRLELELDLNRRKVDHEVVILEALSAEALLKTHRRYFQTLEEIAAAFKIA